MEVKICAPVSGKCVRLLVEEGDILGPSDDVVIIQ
jgi:urea carboxylase/allophanate hydrolase